MDFLMSMILFDKELLIKRPEQKKRYSYLFVICLVLLTSLVVTVAKTIVFDETILKENIQQVDSLEKNQVIYVDGLNEIKIENESVFLNGDRMFSISDLNEKLGTVEIISCDRGQVKFILFVYQYLSTFKYLLLFILLLMCLALVAQKQIKLVDDISLRLSVTYTSYILSIPVLVSVVVRFLNLRFSFSILLLTVLSIVLEYLFVDYYIRGKSMNDEEKMT